MGYAEIVETRLARRDFLRGAAWAGAAALLPKAGVASLTYGASFQFAEISKAVTQDVQLPEGYYASVVLKWGQPLVSGAPAFNANAQTPEAQAKQVGYNCDFIGFFPPANPANKDRAILCVNHEYVNPHLMFDGIEKNNISALNKHQLRVCLEAVGASVAELQFDAQSGWQLIANSALNRRITATTPMMFSGPVAGHKRVQTSYDPAGKTPLGTFGNCAGGITPWGTYLTCEENIDMAFMGDLPEGHSETRNHKRFGVGASDRNGWGNADDRFDVSKEPNEANRFGYVVEIDPYDPKAAPIKHSALGRFKHESATCVLNADGRAVVYSGDDQMFEYLYKFVSKHPVEQGANGIAASVLNEGTLYVAQFSASGKLQWLPLIYGVGPLIEANGFHSQADVLIESRTAGELLGATPMDRPEDIEVNPATGDVFVAFTNNVRRTTRDAANPRAANPHGHILRLMPHKEDGQLQHAADSAEWDILLMGGNPNKPADKALYRNAPSEQGWLSCPDNMEMDIHGNLWIGTDGQPKTIGMCDSLYACPLSGPDAGKPRLFMNMPEGAESTGPRFSADGCSLFASVQHPGEQLKTRPNKGWPDYTEGVPPRPSVVVVRHKSGKAVGYA